VLDAIGGTNFAHIVIIVIAIGSYGSVFRPRPWLSLCYGIHIFSLGLQVPQAFQCRARFRTLLRKVVLLYSSCEQ